MIIISRRASSSSRRRTQAFTRVIDVDHINEFKEYTVVWFANAALTYFSSINIYRGFIDPRIIRGSYGVVCSEAQLLLRDERVKRIEDEVKELIPIPLNDTVQRICDIAQGSAAPLVTGLDWYFAPEFGEFVKVFIPYRYDGEAFARRRVYGISTDVARLAVIGVYITYVYRDIIKKGYGRKYEYEYGFVFLDVPEPQLINFKQLQGDATIVLRAVHDGEGSKLASCMGVASVIAHIVGSMLNYLQPFSLHFIRLAKESGVQKVRIIGVDFVDLTTLARALHRLRISDSVYSLMRLYPSAEKQKGVDGCKQFRRFLEELSRAIMIYAELGDAEALYRVLRSVVHEDGKINDDISACFKALKAKKEWNELRMSLFSINI